MSLIFDCLALRELTKSKLNMKKPTILSLIICALLFVNCSTDNILITENNVSPNFRVLESNGTLNRVSVDDPCMVVDLIAGQHIVVGTLSIDTNEEDLNRASEVAKIDVLQSEYNFFNQNSFNNLNFSGATMGWGTSGRRNW